MKTAKSRAEEVRDLVRGVVERENLELVEVELVMDRGQQILRMYIDTIPPGDKTHGVSVEDCSRVSRIVSDLLDVEDRIEGSYVLEVSSPGLFRPLTKPEHFDRALGQRIKVKTFEKIDGRKVFTGPLVRRDGEAIAVNVDGREFVIGLERVAKANLEPLL